MNTNDISGEQAQKACLEASAVLRRMGGNIKKVILGKDREIQMLLVCLTAGGHALIEDLPGLGKTSLAEALSRSADCTFRRIQFTPDVLPSDITGFNIFNQKSCEFEYRVGCAEANFVLADEINRAGPKTQSSLLEVMEERQITVEGRTRRMPEPFMVIATQNPSEYIGTYPLPEAQTDRFLMRLSLGYPNEPEELEMLSRHRHAGAVKRLSPTTTAAELAETRKLCELIYSSPATDSYIVRLTRATREYAGVKTGVSPRGSLALSRAAKAYALFDGRTFVLPDDVKAVAPYVMSHRLALTQKAKLDGVSPDGIINSLLHSIPVPTPQPGVFI